MDGQELREIYAQRTSLDTKQDCAGRGAGTGRGVGTGPALEADVGAERSEDEVASETRGGATVAPAGRMRRAAVGLACDDAGAEAEEAEANAVEMLGSEARPADGLSGARRETRGEMVGLTGAPEVVVGAGMDAGGAREVTRPSTSA